MRVLLLTSAALAGFAANSLLTRAALAPPLIDAASFTLIRLATGAISLAIVLRIRRGPRLDSGRWESAAMLAIYAVAFTVAYTRIGAASGALLLFGAVQVTMIGAGVARGERPRARDWTGMLLAGVGLLVLTAPGAAGPDVIGAALMIIGGICWGVYSLAGRGSRDSLASTAGNFHQATLIALLSLAWFLKDASMTTAGVVLAAVSGSVASGVCYTLWYAVLPALAAWRAALVQLIVPVLTAFGAVAFLDESIDRRLIAATVLVGAGVWLTTSRSRLR